MGTQRSATVSITNNSGGNAWILLFHDNSSTVRRAATGPRRPAKPSGTLTVYFETGWGSWDILDYWSALIHVKDGPAPGFYVSSGTLVDPYWKECQLQQADADKTLSLSVSTTEFDVALQCSSAN